MSKLDTKKPKSEKVGPWRREDYESFLALDCELKPTRRGTPLKSLLGVNALMYPNFLMPPTAADQQQVIDEAWKARKEHPVYRWLRKDANFNAAWKVFEHRMKVAKTGNLASPSAPFVFLHEFVEIAGWVHDAPSGPTKSKSGGYSKDRSAAIKNADLLHALLSAGVGLNDYSDTQRLRELLQKLSIELRETKRKRYGGKGAIERSLLKSFAIVLNIRCDLISPAVVSHFANMVGLKCDDKKAQRYCNEAKRYVTAGRRKAIASSMTEQASKPTA